ncbi:MAG: hypothetical protein WBA88_26195 [Pseudaminobacter sp.]
MPASTTIAVEIGEDLSIALQRFMTHVGVDLSEAEAIQAALRDWAMSNGYLPAQIEQDNKEDGTL